MRTILAGLALVLALCGTAGAQTQTYTQEQLTLAREVVALSAADVAMDDMLDVMAPSIADQIVASGASREVANRFVELFREEFRADAPRMLEMISIGYASTLTLEELRDVRDFYASPSGRALIENMSAINATMVQVGSRMGEEIGQRALARLEAERAQQPHNP